MEIYAIKTSYIRRTAHTTIGNKLKFDVIKFLQDYNIPFKERAPNLKKGKIGVNCPFNDYID